MLSVPAESRALARSVPPLTARVAELVCPVWKKLSTLSGCGDHGDAAVGLVNCKHGALVSYVFVPLTNVHPVVRPSSIGPQLWSAPSFTPPPAPFTNLNCPPAPWP